MSATFSRLPNLTQFVWKEILWSFYQCTATGALARQCDLRHVLSINAWCIKNPMPVRYMGMECGKRNVGIGNTKHAFCIWSTDWNCEDIYSDVLIETFLWHKLMEGFTRTISAKQSLLRMPGLVCTLRSRYLKSLIYFRVGCSMYTHSRAWPYLIS